MAPGSYNFRIASLNIRGINKHSKRISTFNWIKSKNFDVIFLQETFSSKADENLWQSEWGGPIFWSHGSKHSCGVSILVRKGFDLDPVQVVSDVSGRYIILKAEVQGETLYMINVYAPNTDKDKSVFFKQLHGVITQMGITRNEYVIVGGDWNTILDANIDKAGGVVKKGDTKTLEMKLLIIDIGLINIW